MSNIKIKDTLFPCTDTPEIPHLRFHKDNVYYANLDPEEYMNNNYKPKNDQTNINNGPMAISLTTTNPRTIKRIDENSNITEFNPKIKAYSNIREINDPVYGKLIEFPITYVKLNDGLVKINNANQWFMEYWISDHETEGFHVHPAFIGKDGKPHKLQISKYFASNKDGIPFSEDKGTDTSNYWNINQSELQAKRWMTDDIRPYNIYDHYFLCRLMAIEYGKFDLESTFMQGIEYDNNKRTSYRGIIDILGPKRYFSREGYIGSTADNPITVSACWIDGLTTTYDYNSLKGNTRILSNDGTLVFENSRVRLLSSGYLLGLPLNKTTQDGYYDVKVDDLFIPAGSLSKKDYDSPFNDIWMLEVMRYPTISTCFMTQEEESKYNADQAAMFKKATGPFSFFFILPQHYCCWRFCRLVD